MITKISHEAHIVTQTAQEGSVPEPSIAVHHDNSSPPYILLTQENREIIVDCNTVKDLCKAINTLKKIIEQKEGN